MNAQNDEIGKNKLPVSISFSVTPSSYTVTTVSVVSLLDPNNSKPPGIPLPSVWRLDGTMIGNIMLRVEDS
jgi:hypothetical protein